MRLIKLLLRLIKILYFQKEKKGKLVKVVVPECKSECSSNMGEADQLDKQVLLYRTRICGKKWSFPIFTQSFLFFFVSDVNY